MASCCAWEEEEGEGGLCITINFRVSIRVSGKEEVGWFCYCPTPDLTYIYTYISLAWMFALG